MAWNKSNESGEAISRSLRGKSGLKRSGDRFPLRGVIVGSVVVLGAAGAWWGLSSAGGGGSNSSESSKPKLIKQVTPASAPQATAQPPPPPPRKKYKDMTRDEKLEFLRKEFGDNPPDGYKAELYFLKHPPKENIRPYGNSPVNAFKHHCERAIASALTMEPGAPMLMKPTFDARLDADFAQHAVDAIEIGDDDTDEVKALKQAVAETKKELIDRVKNGENPSDILNAHMDSMYELGKYKSQMSEMINEMRNDPSKSDDDIRDLVTAANKLLRDKGAQEFEMPNLFARQAKLQAMARREKQKETNE